MNATRFSIWTGDAPSATVSEILLNPAAFAGKDVKLSVRVGEIGSVSDMLAAELISGKDRRWVLHAIIPGKDNAKRLLSASVVDVTGRVLRRGPDSDRAGPEMIVTGVESHRAKERKPTGISHALRR